MLVAGGGNALNDCCDLEADRINRPRRPLPSGRLSPGFAKTTSVVLFAAGLALGAAVSPASAAIALAVTGMLVFYAIRGKRLGIAGNLLVALAGALAFVYGGVAAGQPRPSLVPAAFALLMHLAREMVKDVQDLEGDRAIGARTTAIVHGERKTLAMAAAALGLLVLMTPVPFLIRLYNWRYLAAVLLGVDPMLAFLIKDLLSRPGPDRLVNVSFYLKINMLMGLMAISLGL